MNTDRILANCDQIDLLVQQIREEVATPIPPEPPIDETVITAGDDLQAALNVGGNLYLDAGAAFVQSASYRVTVHGTRLTGKGNNRVESSNDHAFDIPIDVDNLTFADIEVKGEANEAVQIGVNGTSQATVESAPDGVRFERIHSIGHRGKRVFDVNAANVTFHQCEVRDCYSPDNVDSQAICVLNAPGPVIIEGGYLEGASENIMVGGDWMKIPDCRPTGIRIIGVTLTKPLAWKDASNPKVKNLLELKDGNDVIIEDCDLSNCWKSAQDGYCFMFTPSNGGSVRGVIVRNCVVSNVGGIVNVTGLDASAINPDRTQVTIEGGNYKTNSTVMGGTGRFALLNRHPESFSVEGATIQITGSTFIDAADDGQSIELLRVVGCSWNYGSYGIRIDGYNHGDNSRGIIKSMIIEGNTITGAHSSFRSRWPNNTYLESMTTIDERFVDHPQQISKYKSALRDELARLWKELGIAK